MPPKNSGGSSKFRGGHKVIHRTAQTASVRVVTPRSCDYEQLEYWHRRPRRSTGFLFSYHSAIPEIFFQRLLFHCTCWLWGTISIHFLSSSAFWGFRKALEQDAMFSSVSVVRRLEISKHVRDLIILHNNFIRNVVSYSNFERSQKCHCYQLHWYTLFEKCLWRCLINSGLKSPALGSRF